MDDWHTYMMLLYNNWNNDLNITVNGEIFPELTGQNFPEKIAELWEEWYRKPKVRYEYIKKLATVLPKMLPESSDSSSEIIQEGLEFKRFANPRIVIKNQLSKFIDGFEHLKLDSRHTIEDNRKLIVGDLNNELESVFVATQKPQL